MAVVEIIGTDIVVGNRLGRIVGGHHLAGVVSNGHGHLGIGTVVHRHIGDVALPCLQAVEVLAHRDRAHHLEDADALGIGGVHGGADALHGPGAVSPGGVQVEGGVLKVETRAIGDLGRVTLVLAGNDHVAGLSLGVQGDLAVNDLHALALSAALIGEGVDPNISQSLPVLLELPG